MAEVATFLWEGRDRQGRRQKGERSAASVAQIKAALIKEGIRPTHIKKRTLKLGQGKVEPRDIMVFTRQMATMMSAGVPMVQALEIIGNGHDNQAVKAMVLAIKGDIEAGGTMASALAKHPKHFDALSINLIAAGEQSGAMETMLHNLATYKEKTESLKAKIKKAMYYPVAVVIVALIVSTILLVFVVPQFATIFESLGADLPALTKVIVDLSDFLIANLVYVLVGAGVFVYGFLQLKRRNKTFAFMLDRYSLKIPIVGEILDKSVVARFSRTMAIMFSAGTPLVEAMVSVAGACGNLLYHDAVMKMRDEVATGTQLQVAMTNTQLFPNMVVQMVAIGEESGALDDMLSKVADTYEEDVDNMVESLSSLMEPIIIVFLGGIIGTLVVAMYLPIFKISEAI